MNHARFALAIGNDVMNHACFALAIGNDAVNQAGFMVARLAQANQDRHAGLSLHANMNVHRAPEILLILAIGGIGVLTMAKHSILQTANTQ